MSDALKIIEERFAKGEISKSEYDTLKRELTADTESDSQSGGGFPTGAIIVILIVGFALYSCTQIFQASQRAAGF